MMTLKLKRMPKDNQSKGNDAITSRIENMQVWLINQRQNKQRKCAHFLWANDSIICVLNTMTYEWPKQSERDQTLIEQRRGHSLNEEIDGLHTQIKKVCQ